ncbi:AAA family ATPase [Pandoraea fibrosis]|uniref:AAA family ATPase n=1 Tax=Pandoraea fibrosis TaxID=1891094 RepID=A0ABX6HSJ0_9BURK|nr:AAA family ATPase [Pandoraea fibrosis]QHE92820.1 AAA family ATPase [Pandoraea fibrosis]QHF13623.1 AAA family ATPase [Pandoraea fibrosis]
MKVYVRNRRSTRSIDEATYPHLVLTRDSWNDYSYYTLFGVELRLRKDSSEERISLKSTSIMRKGQREGLENRPFEELGDCVEIPEATLREICSLSSNQEYYDALEKLDSELAREILTTLRDASLMKEIREEFQSEPCFKISLLRESTARELLDTAGPRFGTEQKLISRFQAEIPLPGASVPHRFDFDFRERQGVPHRINSIVGLNGVGKTQVMARLAMLLSGFSKAATKERRATLGTEGMLEPLPSIYTVVAVSFSAFDEFDRPTKIQGENFKYSYCGLQGSGGRLKNKETLLSEIKEMLSNSMEDEKRILLKSALKHLVRVDNIDDFVDYPNQYSSLYERLSAGQRLALNCILHIISKIGPRTLVLFDEPELHLHPQLLTGLLNSLSEILEKQDSFSIIATHSPLVIQQLPKECVHIVKRDRSTPLILKPTFQTFGENVSDITRFVFSATESDRDYRNILDKMFIDNNGDVDAILRIFDNQLSLNANIYLESLRASKDV